VVTAHTLARVQHQREELCQVTTVMTTAGTDTIIKANTQ